MPLSNYPNGFPSGIVIRNVPIMQTHPGRVFWVSNVTTGLPVGHRSGSDSNKGDFNSPFATLEYALSQCYANRGDIIFIKPGHAESIASATALNFDVAGVAVVGLGSGSNRPTFTYTTANTATIPVTAANMSVQNCLLVGNFLSIASAFTLATAPNFTIQNCEFADTSAVLGFLSIVTTTVSLNADNLAFLGNKVVCTATTTPGPTVVVANTMSGLTIADNRITHTTISNNVSALLEHGALVMTDLLVQKNKVFSVNTDTATGAILVKTTAITGSGQIIENYIRALDIAAAIVVTATAVQYGLFENLYIGDGTSNSGFILPAIGTDA